MIRKLTALVVFCFISTANAHDIYEGLTSPTGTNCCHDRDCRPVEYRIVSGGAEFKVGDAWVFVPE